MDRSISYRRGPMIALVLMILVAAGCASDDGVDPTTTTTAGDSTSTSSGSSTSTDGAETGASAPAGQSTTTSDPVDREPTPADPAGFSWVLDGQGERSDLLGNLAFTTPTGNIRCEINGSSTSGDDHLWASCEAMEHTWSIPEEPCELDWDDHIVTLGADGVSKGECTGGVLVSGGSNVLDYDRSLTQGPITCVSRRTGVVCTYAGTTHRFRISRSELDIR